MNFEQQLADFERDGYLIIPQVLPGEMISRLLKASDKWLASDYQTMRQPDSDGSTDGFTRQFRYAS